MCANLLFVFLGYLVNTSHIFLQCGICTLHFIFALFFALSHFSLLQLQVSNNCKSVMSALLSRPSTGLSDLF